jgi:hypothetical protein
VTKAAAATTSNTRITREVIEGEMYHPRPQKYSFLFAIQRRDRGGRRVTQRSSDRHSKEDSARPCLLCDLCVEIVQVEIV